MNPVDASSVGGGVNNSTEALVAEVFNAMNTRQLEKIRDVVTDDFVDHGSPIPLPPGPDGYIAILTFVTTVLQVRYEVDDIVAAGDMVAIRATAHGVNAVSPQGVETTGKPFAMKTAHFFRSRDGRLCEHWGVRDELDVLYQVGALDAERFFYAGTRLRSRSGPIGSMPSNRQRCALAMDSTPTSSTAAMGPPNRIGAT